jgi:hypothetical protein
VSNRCAVRDVVTFSRREITPEGYLVAPAVLGRCGVQVYTRAELGLDGDPKAQVRLMRTPEEALRPETIASFENKPITYRHPETGVDASKCAQVTKGHVRDCAKLPGNLLGGTTWVMDGEQVSRVVAGDAHLSSGYGFELDLTPGKDDGGQAFDGYQRNILGDHLAILDRVLDSPRGGPICRISDNERKTMAMKKLAVDGLPRFEIDELAAESIETAFKGLTGERDQVIADFATHVKDSRGQLAAKDAELKTARDAAAALAKSNAELVSKLDKALAIDVDALVAERATVIGDAKKLAPGLEPKGSSAAIRRAAVVAACSDSTSKLIVDKIIGDAGIEKSTDAQVSTAFAVLLALPRQAQLAAQDAALAGVLGGGSNSAINNGSVEVVDLSSRSDIYVGSVS